MGGRCTECLYQMTILRVAVVEWVAAERCHLVKTLSTAATHSTTGGPEDSDLVKTLLRVAVVERPPL